MSEQTLVWNIHTTAGRRFGVLTNEECQLFECIEYDNGHMPDLSDPKALDGVNMDMISRFKAPEVGKMLGRVDADAVGRVIERAARTKAGAAVDLLLRIAKINADDVQLSSSYPPEEVAPDGLQMLLLAVCGQQVFKIMIFNQGAVLVPFGEEDAIMKVSMEDVTDHALRFAM